MRIRNVMTVIFFGLAFCVWAAETAPLVIPETLPPKLDGTLDDPAWQNALKIEQLYPAKSDQPANDTTVYMARDKKWLYLGFKCVNSNMAHVAQLIYDHDGSVHTDDSVEIGIRPEAAKDRYYHLLLNFANVTAEQRCNKEGMRERGWNPPLRSMTKLLPDGWTAELAIPLFSLESDDLGSMQVNICRNVKKIDLDAYGSKQNEQSVGRLLKPGNSGSFHDLNSFLAVSGMGGFKPEIPFAPKITAAAVTGLRQKDGKYFYDVKITLETASSVAGKAKILVIEDIGAGDIEKFSELVDLDGKRELVLNVPAGDLRERKVRVTLVDPTDGNMLAGRAIDDMSALSVIRKAFVGRSYYTSEEAAAIRLELGLPEAMLKEAVLAIDVNGRKIPETKGLKPVMTPEVPLSALKIGENILTLHVMMDGKELTSQKLAVQKLEPRPGFEVKTDFIKGIILKDDKPVFPVAIFAHPLGSGIAACGVKDGEEGTFKFLSEAGFNALLLDSKTNTALFMKLADKYGLNVIEAAAPQPFPIGMQPGTWPPPPVTMPLAERLALQKKWYEKLEPGLIENAKIQREHRNMLGYYNVDEPNLVNADERIAAADWYWHSVTPIDPYRPMYILYARDIPRCDNWTKWGQLLGFDWYPGYPYPSGDFYTEPGLASAWFAYELRKRCRQDNKIMFFIPGVNMLDPGRTPVGMSKAHMLCQTYSVIIYGARGLMYFCLSAVIGENGWDALRTINTQIKELAPALLNGDVAQDIRYTPDNFKPEERKFPMVNAAVFKYPDGDYLIMAANIIPFAVDTSFRLDGLQKATRLFDDKKKMRVKDGMFAEKIEPYGVRAYKIKLAGNPEPVQVAVEMKALEDERYPNPDVPGIKRQVMLGKNYIPNPCFKQQTNKGVPDFYEPYFCLGVDFDACKKGSSWYVDNEMLWNGNPSLRMFRNDSVRTKTGGPEKSRGTWAAWCPPPSDKPVKMTFSFYAKCDKAGDTLSVAFLMGKPKDFPLTTEWQRYQYTGDVPPGAGGFFLLCPNLGQTVWISGLQLEAGETATEFQDDSIIEKKK